MGAAIASLIAVSGTLLGSLVTYLFQGRTLVRSERLARERQLRDQQIAVLSEFARAIADYRGGQTDVWHRREEDSAGAAHEEARLRSHRLRAVVNQELFRLRIVVDDPSLVRAAQEALEGSWTLHEPTADEEFAVLRRTSREAIDRFVDRANDYVQSRFSHQQ